MEFSIHNGDSVAVAHQGVRHLFNVSLLKKSNLIIPGKDLFLEINQYMETLERDTQFKIFQIYAEFRDLRDDSIGVSFSAQQKESTDLVTELYRLLDLDRLERFIRTTTIVYPDNLFSRNSEQAAAANINQNINYYKEDYDGLVLLVIALRPMIPIWGEYINLHKAATGTHYKEYRALKLISNSSINSSPYMERLRMYITEWRTTGSARNNLTDDIAVLDGISSDDLTDYILGLILVRRLSLCNVHANTEKDSIISSIYSYLKSKLSEAANTFKTYKKYDDGAGRENGEEMSILEKYKISSKLTHGDREFLKECSRLPVNIAKEIDPSVDLFVLEECLTLNHSLDLRLSDHQKLITQWVTDNNNAFPAQGIDDLNRIEVINLVSVAQAILIHWEFYDIALLVTSAIVVDSINIATPVRIVLNEKLLAQLDEIYPYQKSQRRQVLKPNIAYDAIHTLNNDLMSKTFIVHPTATLQDKHGVKPGHYTCPRTLVDSFAELFIKANS